MQVNAMTERDTNVPLCPCPRTISTVNRFHPQPRVEHANTTAKHDNGFFKKGKKGGNKAQSGD